MFVIGRSLTPIRFTRCGPRHVVASRIIPSLTTSLRYLTFFVYREIFIPFLSPPSPVLSRLLQRGAPRAVPSPPLPSRSVKLVEDFLPMILVVYVFHWGTYPTFVRISVVSPLFPGVCTHINVILTALSWKIEAYSARASCPPNVFHNPSQNSRLALAAHRVYLRPRPPPPPKCLKPRTGRQRLPAPKPSFVLLSQSSDSHHF